MDNKTPESYDSDAVTLMGILAAVDTRYVLFFERLYCFIKDITYPQNSTSENESTELEFEKLVDSIARLQLLWQESAMGSELKVILGNYLEQAIVKLDDQGQLQTYSARLINIHKGNYSNGVYLN